MKKLLFLMLAVSCALSFSIFEAQYSSLKTSQTITAVTNQYHKNLDQVSKSLETFVKLSVEFKKGSIQENEIQVALTVLRNQFKKVEFLFDYLEPELTATFINGAPLPKLEKHIPEIVVIEPNGLQTLDELVWLSPNESKNEIEELALQLQRVWNEADVLMRQKRLEHRYIIESIRYGVIRIFSIGVTGFDTPGSANAMEENQIAWASMKNVFDLYGHYEKAKSQFNDVQNLMDVGQQLLNGTNNFENFDHLNFVKRVVTPLYQNLYAFQRSMQIEMKSDVDKTLSAHNYKSQLIFSEDFLNPSFYTKIAKSDLFDPLKIELGKTLFFDPALSRDLTMSCASCHDPKKGFTDGLPKSKTNLPNVTTVRHAPTLVNSALYGRFFWDMREYDLERQIKHVVHNDLEFNMDFIDLAERLKESTEYVDLFDKAYSARDKYGISTWSISNALAAYINSLTSFNSPFDQYVNGQTESLNEEIKKGYNLFMGKAACGTCHFAPTFSGLVPPFYKDSESEVLGVTTDFDTLNPILDLDPGRRYNGLPSEEADHFLHSIKTVTVRNAGITAPYFHNGAFDSLEEVVHFYNHGGGAGMGLELENQTLPSDRLNLTNTEMKQIVKFMESLTDTTNMTHMPLRLPVFESHPEWNDRLDSYSSRQ